MHLSTMVVVVLMLVLKGVDAKWDAKVLPIFTTWLPPLKNPYLSKNSSRAVFSRAHSGDAHQTPPETVIETPVLITALLGKENQTESNKEEKLEDVNIETLTTVTTLLLVATTACHLTHTK